MRWVTDTADYDFVLIHKLGAEIMKSDLLLRQVDHERGENDYSDIIILKDGFFI